jgi:glucose-1-phosphate adenylyltransferase
VRAIAVILAGGEGSRLSVLTAKRAKPAVPFAGKYRIIDFVLSNCVHSDIYTVGVLTQYRPRSLNEHIWRGRPWDLDRMRGGVALLQPYVGREDSEWYQGTADAVCQNLDWVEHHNPDHILVLSGDHIYRMDYDRLLRFHEQHEADLTIAAIEVKPEDISRFGILTIEDDHRVVDFQEKPVEATSTLASTGIYAFRTPILCEWLQDDASDGSSTHDFGADIIPKMLAGGAHLCAYPFRDYWVDVGTVQAYWEANMDLLLDRPAFNLYDRGWIFYTRSEERPPMKVKTGAVIHRSLICDGCVIEGTVEYSVLSPDVQVRASAVIRDSIIMTDAVIGPEAVLDRVIIDKNVIVGRGVHLGFGEDYSPNLDQPQPLRTGISLVGKNTLLPAGIIAGRNVVIGCDLPESAIPGPMIPSGTTVDMPPSEKM